MPCPCQAHAVPLPCRAAKALECVLLILFTQCGRVWFTFAIPCPCPCHAPTMPFLSKPQHSTTVSRRPCCALRRTAWSEHGMASVNHTRPHCVNQMGKTHSKPLAARHGRGTACELHAMFESTLQIKKRSWPHLRHYSRKATHNLSHDSLRPDLDSTGHLTNISEKPYDWSQLPGPELPKTTSVFISHVNTLR